MSEESLVSPVRKTGPQPAEHRPARKAYFSPELKVYGKMAELTASGSGPLTESDDVVGGDIVCIFTAQASCRL
jgi:hypothetical protein